MLIVQRSADPIADQISVMSSSNCYNTLKLTAGHGSSPTNWGCLAELHHSCLVRDTLFNFYFKINLIKQLCNIIFICLPRTIWICSFHTSFVSKSGYLFKGTYMPEQTKQNGPLHLFFYDTTNDTLWGLFDHRWKTCSWRLYHKAQLC